MQLMSIDVESPARHADDERRPRSESPGFSCGFGRESVCGADRRIKPVARNESGGSDGTPLK